MVEAIKEFSYEGILELLKEYDTESTYEKVNIIPDSREMHVALSEYIQVKTFKKRSVVGIDIYRYSGYKHLEQTLIPTIFKILFKKAIRLCIENNQFVFQNYKEKDFEKSFINTGDGGFVILDTPLHALFFTINFELMVRAYNSYHLFPKLRNIVGSISLRYAITDDTIFKYDNNFYGSAIINNSRILERDSLNRCLIDQNTYDWFLINIDGIENLQILTIDDMANIYEFQDYDKEIIESGVNEIMTTSVSRYTGIINSDISKIGQIQTKQIFLNIYNLHLQVCMKIFADENRENKRTITMSLGNLNTSGI